MTGRIQIDTFTNADHIRDHDTLNDLAFRLNRACLLITLYGAKHDLEEKKIQHRVVGAHAHSAVNSIASVLSLTKDLSLQVREAVILSRGIYETLLVGAFCSIDDGERAKRALLYSIYKSVRNQTQHATLGSLTVKISKLQRIDRKHPKVVEAMTLFGGSRNIRPCFTESRSDMVSAIEAKDKPASVLFSGAEAMIYDISSEIAHGSYYAWDAFHAKSGDQLENLQQRYHSAHFTILLSVAAFCRCLRADLIPSKYFNELEEFAMSALYSYDEEYAGANKDKDG